MSKYIYYVVALVIGAAICFVLVRQCSEKPLGPNHDSDKKAVDSIVRLLGDSLQKKFNDSLSFVKDSTKKVVDSLKAIVASDKYNNQVTAQEIEGLVATIRATKDTSKKLANCDSLQNAAIQGIALVKKTMKDRDDLDSAYKDQIKIRDDAASRLNSMFTQSNQQLFQIGRKYDSLYEDYKKINKKPTHWSIGPGVGATIINGKAQPIVDLSIHYDLFKF